MNFASDHILLNIPEFHHVMTTVADVASDMSHLITVGIAPVFPHTGLGYIHAGAKVKELDNLPVCEVSQFVEKPNLENKFWLLKLVQSANTIEYPPRLASSIVVERRADARPFP